MSDQELAYLAGKKDGLLQAAKHLLEVAADYRQMATQPCKPSDKTAFLSKAQLLEGQANYMKAAADEV